MGWASGVVCGPGRNDGTNRIYAAGWNRLYEFSWNGSSWVPMDMGTTLGWGVALGQGRNDDTMRVYATFTVVGPQYGGVYEHTWNGSSWTRRTVATFPSSPSSSAGHGIALGLGQNDGVVRVYSCDCNNNRTFESTWTGSAWNTVQIFDWSSTDLVVARGRGDGVYRLYCTHQGSALREYTWDGAAWTYVDLDPTSSWYYDVSVGVGRNDGVARVYAGSSLTPRGLYEFTWTDTIWQKARMGTMPNMPRCVVVGPGRNDSVNRLYSGTTGGSRYAVEFSWNGATWDSSWVDSTGGSGSYQDATIGDGRNDGIKRLYMASSDGSVYEFTYSWPGVEESQDARRQTQDAGLLHAYPNPFTTETHIAYSISPIAGAGGAVSHKPLAISLSIFDLTGRLVHQLPATQLPLVLGDGLKPGIYFVRAKGYKLAKVVKLR